MKKILTLLLLTIGISLTAQRYRPAKIIFKDSSSRNGLIENFLGYDEIFNPGAFKKRILFKKTARSRRELLDTKKIDRIILLDKNMDVKAIFDFVPIKEFYLLKRSLPLTKKTKTKFLPLWFETEKYRVYKYTKITTGQGASKQTIVYIRHKGQNYAVPFVHEQSNVIVNATYVQLINLLRIRAMQEFGKDCPAFLDYLKPLYQKYNAKDRETRKQRTREYKKLRKSFKSKDEFEFYILMSYLKKYDELCGKKGQAAKQQSENAKPKKQ